MKLALIPPKGLEQRALEQNIHLVLAQNDWHAYKAVYREARERGDYIIMDNGANEGKQVSDIQLLARARNMFADEIVIPDVMKDKKQTINRAAAFLDLVDATFDGNKYKYMAVLQGESIREALLCVQAFAMSPLIKVIGIPRHLIKTCDDPTARIKIAATIHKHFTDKFEMHFLGTCSSTPDEVYHAAKYRDYIRSVDTSMPFNYAAAARRLHRDLHIDRPVGYFEKSWMALIDRELMAYNVEVMRAWADGRQPSEASLGTLRGVPFSG